MQEIEIWKYMNLTFWWNLQPKIPQTVLGSSEKDYFYMESTNAPKKSVSEFRSTVW